MRRTGEDRTGAVIHQDEVRDPDRQFPFRVQRVTDLQTRIQSQLLGLLQGFLGGAALLALGAERLHLWVRRGEFLGQRMIGGDTNETRPHQRIWPRRVNCNRLAAIGTFEGKLQTARPADPVLLHQLHLGWPVIQPVDRFQQFLRETADLEEPLRQLAPLHLGTRAPALAVDHLLVRQNRHVDRVPVHHRILAVNQPLLHEVDEHRLLLTVILRVAGREHPAPVQPEAQRLHLRDHRVDIIVGPRLRMSARRHRRVLGRHPEGVKPHRMQNVVAGRQLVPRDHVAHRIIPHMTDMDAPRRIGEHLQHVILGLRLIALRDKGARLFPGGLPFRFNGFGVVARHIFGSCGLRVPPDLTEKVRRSRDQCDQRSRSRSRNSRARVRIASSTARTVAVGAGPFRVAKATFSDRASRAGSRI